MSDYQKSKIYKLWSPLIQIELNIDSEENIVISPVPKKGSIDLPSRNVALVITDDAID